MRPKMSAKYDQYNHNPTHMRLFMKSDDSVVFGGLMIGHKQWDYDFTIGHQFVGKPFKGDNPFVPITSMNFSPSPMAIQMTRMISVPRFRACSLRWHPIFLPGT